MTKIGFVSLLLDFESESIDKRVFANINSKFELPYRFITDFRAMKNQVFISVF